MINNRPKFIFLGIGIIVSLGTSIAYFIFGFNPVLPFFWLISIALTSAYFWQRQTKTSGSLIFTNIDLYIIGFLLLIFAPLYLTFIYTIPYQISTDEILLTSIARSKVTAPNLFAISPYGNFPAFTFVIFRSLIEFFGGVNLLNMRIVHSLFGITIVAFSYFFFSRLTNSRFFGLCGAILLATQHVFLIISRMALRDIPTILIEMIVAFFAVAALKKLSSFNAFLLGCAAALSFYNYFPPGSGIVLLVFYYCLYIKLVRSRISFQKFWQIASANILAIIMVSLPLFVSIIKIPPNSPNYYQKQLLIFPEGRQVQQIWVNAPTIEAAVKKNIANGLTIFNSGKRDTGAIYINPGHSFVDPITGILIWAGLLLIIIRKQKTDAQQLIIGAFIGILLMLSFVVNKAPHYDRSLVILPFVILLTLEVLIFISYTALKFLGIHASRLKIISPIIVLALVFTISALNLKISGEYIQKGLTLGDDFGGPARYVESKSALTNYHFILVTSGQYPFFPWDPDWISPLISKSQSVKVIGPEELNRTISQFKDNPFSILISLTAWQKIRPELNSEAQWKILNLKPDASKLAIEVN